MKLQDTKSFVFLYINKLSKKEVLKIPFTVASKTIKYLGINLIKGVKDLYIENCKTLMKEMEEETQMERYPMFIHQKN